MIPLIIAYGLNIIDYIFTAYWVHNYGVEIEGNPFGRWLFNHNIAWLFKIVIVGLIFALLWQVVQRYPKAIIAVYILLGVYALLVIYHIIIAVKVWSI